MSTIYFPPSYFAPSYFFNLSPSSSTIPVVDPTPTPPSTRTRDRDAYRAIVDELTALDCFDQVLFGPAGGWDRAGADRYPVLVVTPKGWQEMDDSDPIALVRLANFTLTIVIRDEDPISGFDELDRLTSLVEEALDYSDLNGSAMGSLTKVRSAKYLPASFPEQSVELDGEFTSLFQNSNPTSVA